MHPPAARFGTNRCCTDCDCSPRPGTVYRRIASVETNGNWVYARSCEAGRRWCKLWARRDRREPRMHICSRTHTASSSEATCVKIWRRKNKMNIYKLERIKSCQRDNARYQIREKLSCIFYQQFWNSSYTNKCTFYTLNNEKIHKYVGKCDYFDNWHRYRSFCTFNTKLSCAAYVGYNEIILY